MNSERLAKEHTDYEFLTLSISTAEGLKLRSPEGDWATHSAKEDHAVLVAGDMFEVISRGYVKSSLHRARCAGQPRRGSHLLPGPALDFHIRLLHLGR